MPIEREFKYVLRCHDTLWKMLNEADTSIVTGKTEIIQAYLGRGGRIRRRHWSIRDSKPTIQIENIFTYKHDLSSQPGCLEIETEISNADFDLAWSEADHKISKVRFILPNQSKRGVWEIDFFKDDQGIYLALAEFEVSADEGAPTVLHPLVEKFLSYPVDEDDNRFKNRKLCERRKVEKLLEDIAK